jgi:ubiquinone/menaquinone biosynthesis C-methylase UbiE
MELVMPAENKSDGNEYKKAAQQNWQKVATGWHKWVPFVSSLLQEETNQMLEMAHIRSGHRVLDIAAGDGDQSILAAHRVGSQGYVLATDLSSNLLAYAANSAREAGLKNLETMVMDAENLELEDAHFDAVICRLGLMLMPNINAALGEIYRVLKSNRWLSAIIFSTPDKNPWISIPVQTAMKHAQLHAPQPVNPGPSSLDAPGVFEGVLKKAGFREINVKYSAATMKLASAAECIEFLQDTSGAIHTILANLNETKQQEAWKEMEHALKEFETPEGFESPVETILAAGQKA